MDAPSKRPVPAGKAGVGKGRKVFSLKFSVFSQKSPD